MSTKAVGLPRRYLAALRGYLKHGAGADVGSGLALGRHAVALGLETLDVARIHEGAIVALALSKRDNALLERAEQFFTAVITPIVRRHAAAPGSGCAFDRVDAKLRRRAAELVASHRQLQDGRIRRKKMEAALKRSTQQYDVLVAEALKLQADLRQMTHRVLAAQENARRDMSRQLQDEIAQTLLGIKVRLLSVEQEASSNSHGLVKEIAKTQRLVVSSAASVRCTARKFTKA